MRILAPLIAVALTSLCGCALTDTSRVRDFYRTVSFPAVALSEGERIQSVEIVITCARFTDINGIPNDWSAEVVSPIAEVSTFRASAGHGMSAVARSSALDDLITIYVNDGVEPCFSIKASMTAFVGEKERTISFSQAELVMKPSPNHALQRTRHGVAVCNPCVPRAGSLSLGR